jgi:hypothetical protein
MAICRHFTASGACRPLGRALKRPLCPDSPRVNHFPRVRATPIYGMQFKGFSQWPKRQDYVDVAPLSHRAAIGARLQLPGIARQLFSARVD